MKQPSHPSLPLRTLAILSCATVTWAADSSPPIGRVATPPTDLTLLTPPSRVPGPLPTFAALMAGERVLPLTPARAAEVRFDAELRPVSLPRRLLNRSSPEPAVEEKSPSPPVVRDAAATNV